MRIQVNDERSHNLSSFVNGNRDSVTPIYKEELDERLTQDLPLLWRNSMGLFGTLIIILIHALICMTRVIHILGEPYKEFCNIPYPSAPRMRLLSGGEYLDICDYIDHLIEAVEGIREIVKNHEGAAVGKYVCPVLRDRCLSIAFQWNNSTSEDKALSRCTSKIQLDTDLRMYCTELFADPKDVEPENYSDCYRIDCTVVTRAKCPKLYTQFDKRPHNNSLYVFYQLDPWFGFFTAYRKKLSVAQLGGFPTSTDSVYNTNCAGVKTALELRRIIARGLSPSFLVPPDNLIHGLPHSGANTGLFPCGYLPSHVFTDEFHFVQQDNSKTCGLKTDNSFDSYNGSNFHTAPRAGLSCRACLSSDIHGNKDFKLPLTDCPKIHKINLDKSEAAIRDEAISYDYLNPEITRSPMFPNYDHCPKENGVISDECIRHAYFLNSHIVQWLPGWLFPGKVENPHFVNWINAHRSTMRGRVRVKWAQFDYTNLRRKCDGSDWEDLYIMIKNRYDVSFYGGTKSIVIGEKHFAKSDDANINFNIHVVCFFGELCMIFLILGIIIWKYIILRDEESFGNYKPLFNDIGRRSNRTPRTKGHITHKRSSQVLSRSSMNKKKCATI